MKTFNRTFIIIVIILFVISILSNFIMFNKIGNMNKKFNNYENTIAAFNDSLIVKIENGIAIWQKKSPEINIDDLINSEFFKSLSEEQQKYYIELSKVKGLIASTKAELEKHEEILKTLNTDSFVVLDKDSITFKRGQELTFKEEDTTKNLQWESNIKLDSISTFAFNYNYKFDIQSDFIRQQDKSIMVQYHINDPDLKMNDMQSFIIPSPDQSKWEKFMDKHGSWIRPVGAALLFGGGVATGYAISR